MASIEQVLDRLDPPLKHSCEKQDDSLVLTLIDPSVSASVRRTLTARELENSGQLQIALLYAVNEIRGKGSHAELKVLPIDGPLTLD